MSDFRLASFAAHVGDAFAVAGMPGTSWTLVAATPFGEGADPAACDAFSLSFLGPPDPVHAQRTATFVHPVLGELAIFVVPIARDAAGVTYQAVFN